jgi:hypothetical protein
MDELKVLQAARLKGRVTPADLAATVDTDSASAAATIAELTEAGFLVAGKALKLSPEGRQRLNTLLAAELSGVDNDAIANAYSDFRGVNAEFKALVADWQLKDGAPNTHEDADYDAGVLARLASVHERVTPIVAAAAAQLPRLGSYSDKLAAALKKVQAGDSVWFTRPLIDSYHTEWFELHEELILAAGLTREGEAKAGHAQ